MGTNESSGPELVIRLSLVVFFFVIASPALVRAEVLPVKTYTTADGLLRDQANCIKQDSRGFLWFCTSDGLSRFDGYGFTNYTTDDGLPHKIVNDFLETRGGVYWVATNDGLARFNPKGKRGISNENQDDSMFKVFKPSDNKEARGINVVFEDSQGVLWCGTWDGLYKIEIKENQIIFHHIDLPKARADLPLTISTIIQDRRGSLWIGTDVEQGLNRILPDGSIEHYATRRESPKNEFISALLETKDGTIWAGMSGNGGLCSLVSEPTRQSSVFSRCFTKKEGLPSNWIFSLYQTSDGKLWFGTTVGTGSLDDKNQLRTYKEAQGLCDKNINAFQEDRDGNLWLSTQCGVKTIVRSGFVRFNESDGLTQQTVNGIFTSYSGELFVITIGKDDKTNLASHRINRFDKDKFIAVEPKLPPNVSTGWGSGQIVVQDKAGDWWLPGDNKAVYRFPKTDDLKQLADAKPQAVKIPDKEVFRIYEDSRSDIWISTMGAKRLLRWERSTATIHDYTDEIGNEVAVCFAEDNNGTVWIGFDYKDLIASYKARYKEMIVAKYEMGRLTVLPINTKTPDSVNSIYVDRASRLWLASSANGVGRIDNPNAAALSVVWHNRKNGLATNGTRDLVEDNFGRMYVVHGRGVDRIDPNTGQIKHYTTADGLPQGLILNAARDSQGILWFGSYQGLARLIPEQDKPRQTPNILLTGLHVAGERQSVSELGETSLPELKLNAHQTQVSIDFLGLGASLGEELKYQYKLEGAGQDWIETSQRTVDFANLSPGSYRFAVRAVTFDNLVSRTPATISFTIAVPIWKRWWFVTLAVLMIAGVAFVGYRYRVNRLLELERVRTRIATDLHDDIGSNLSKISILSEVARQQYEHDGNGETPLGSIANISRESVASMSDIVWAINPQKDSLIDLVRRMRRFAEDTLESRNIVADFRAPESMPELRLGADARRQIYLIFKECINNIVRHSQATQATVELRIEAKELLLTISDNGKGFEAMREYEGNGLASMKRRAEEFGGKLGIESTIDRGTTVTLNAPLAHPRLTLRR